MSFYPHTQLLVGPSRTIAVSGPHIQVLDSNSGLLSSSTVNFEGPDKDRVLKSGPVRCATLSPSGDYLATAGDDKVLKVWEVEGLKLLSQRELPKRPTSIKFTGIDDILVSDKFGDVFKYPLHPMGDIQKTPKDALSSHENPSGGDLILGHTSFLTAFTLSHDQKYIITADRDEHIRVSWYPQGYNIEMYCLGHEKFVSAIHIPNFDPSILISGGGDPTLKVWDWMSGQLRRDIPVLNEVLPYVKIRPQGKKSDADGEGEGQGGTKGRRKKGKKQKKEVEDQIRADLSSEQADVDPTTATAASIEEPPTLVIHKIASLEIEGGRYLVFTAVGATALFSLDLSLDAGLQLLDFENPILDFTLRDDGVCWVCLDGEWCESGAATTMVKVAQFLSGQFSPVVDESPLLVALNSTCLIQASADDLKLLDVYLPLTALPKNPDAEHNAMDRDVTELVETPEDGGGVVAGQKIGKKQMGRLKNKQRLLEKVREVAEATSSEQPNGEAEEWGAADEEPEAKKIRSNTEQSAAPEDVPMTES